MRKPRRAGTNPWQTLGLDLKEVAKYLDFECDPSLELDVQAAMVKDPDFYRNHAVLLQPEFFATAQGKLFCRLIAAYWEKYSAMPTLKIAGDYARAELQCEKEEKDSLLMHMESVWLQQPRQMAYLSDMVRRNGRTRALRAAALAIVQHTRTDPANVDVDRVDEIIQAVTSLSSVGSSRVLSFVKDFKRFPDLMRKREVAIPTGIASMDEALLGGLQLGELGLIIAPPKRGKTLFLVNIAIGALLAGYRVLYITMEDGEEAILSRLYQRALSRARYEVEMDQKATYMRELGKFCHLLHTDIRVVYQEPDVCGLGEIRNVLGILDSQDGFRPDVLILDYADLVKPPVQTQDDWRNLIRLYTAVRAMGRKERLAVWTASQTGRGGYMEDTPDGSHVAGAFGKLGVVDVAFVLCQSSKEREEGVARLSKEALRNRPTGGYLRIFMDRDRHMVTSAPPVTDIVHTTCTGAPGVGTGPA